MKRLPPAVQLVMWVDPGKITGLAWQRVTPLPLGLGRSVDFWTSEDEFQPLAEFIDGIAHQWGPRLAIGWEHFTVDGSTHKKTAAPWSLEMIGAVRFIAGRHRCHVLPPAQPDDRKPASRDMIQRAGWEYHGKDSFAACQHLMAYLLKSGQCPPDLMARIFPQALFDRCQSQG